MARDDEILRELIAQRKKIDDMISLYQKDHGELATTVEETSLKPKEYSFGELVRHSLGHDELVCTREAAQCNIEIINIDNSVHVTNNHRHESHVNTTLAGGDSVIDTIGSLFRGLLD